MGLTEGFKNSSGDLPVGWRKRSRRLIRHGFLQSGIGSQFGAWLGGHFASPVPLNAAIVLLSIALDHGVPGSLRYADKLTRAQAKVGHKPLEIERHDRVFTGTTRRKFSDAGYAALHLRFNAIEARLPEFVSVLDFRFAAHYGLKSDIAPYRESAKSDRLLRALHRRRSPFAVKGFLFRPVETHGHHERPLRRW